MSHPHKFHAPRPKEHVLILDFGAQYTQLIARRVRELGVYSEVVPYNISAKEVASRRPAALIFSGGPASVTGRARPKCDKDLLRLGIPVLGICYGMQIMAGLLGGSVLAASRREYGHAVLNLHKKAKLFYGLRDRLSVWMSHGDRVTRVPRGFEVIAETASSPIAAMANVKKRLYGVQFHPEVVHTPKGTQILGNFLFRVARCKGRWDAESFVHTTVQELRETVGAERVLCATSGGVDSSCLAAILHRAVGDQLECVFVNTGLLRKNEPPGVRKALRRHVGISVHYADASEEFLRRLKGVSDPEHKRRIIGSTFIRVFEREAKRLGTPRFLAQGTIYPDVIESRSPHGGPSSTIKTHHNVGGLPRRMKFELIEPFRFLFKDEVRRVGEQLGLPPEIVWRQPFPGPGLGVRVVGEVTKRKLRILRDADAILLEELDDLLRRRKIWQAFALLLPVKATGVMGDKRTYANVVAVRAITSRDAMTADWARLPHKLLARISNRIMNEVKGVGRVVYDTSSKPPSTIEWE